MSPTVEKQKDFEFKYIIPDDLKDCYVSGAWGGITPRGQIHLHFYSERLPVPKTVVHEFVDGKLKNEPKEVVTGGDAIRLIQSSVIMDVRTAVELRDWLNKKIELCREKE